jgi:hypothetical protein
MTVVVDPNRWAVVDDLLAQYKAFNKEQSDARTNRGRRGALRVVRDVEPETPAMPVVDTRPLAAVLQFPVGGAA